MRGMVRQYKLNYLSTNCRCDLKEVVSVHSGLSWYSFKMISYALVNEMASPDSKIFNIMHTEVFFGQK